MATEELFYGDVFDVAERVRKRERYAKLFAQAMTTTDPVVQDRLIGEIRRMLRMDADQGQDDAC